MNFLRFALLPSIALIIGILLGVFVRDISTLTPVYTFKITDVLSVFITLVIGIFIPLVVKKWIDDERLKNNNLLDELKGLSEIIEIINNRIKQIYEKGKIRQKDKKILDIQFHLSDKEIEALCSFLDENSSKQISGLVNDLQKSYLSYWRVSTSIEVTDKSVSKIEETTFKSIYEKYIEVNQQIRKLKSRILN